MSKGEPTARPFKEIAVKEILKFGPLLAACLPVTYAL